MLPVVCMSHDRHNRGFFLGIYLLSLFLYAIRVFNLSRWYMTPRSMFWIQLLRASFSIDYETPGDEQTSSHSI